MNRRAFLFAGPALLLPRRSPSAIDVRLEPQAGVAGREIVSFGFPLRPDLLDDPDGIQLLDGEGREIEASVTPLEAWRTSGRKGSLRSVLVQARVDFASEKSRRLQVRLHARSKKRVPPLAPVPDSVPRVWALLPASWLSASEVAGPQVPASDSGEFSAYDRLAERSFPRSLAYIESQVFHHWLFDRTTCYYKLYVRTGERRYLEAAHRAASFVRLHTQMDGRTPAPSPPRART